MNKRIGKSSLAKKSRLYYAALAVFVSAIAIAHFVLQMSFIQDKNSRPVETAAVAPPPNEPLVNLVNIVAPEQEEPEKVEIISSPKVVQPISMRRKEIVAPPVLNKRKIVRENRAERLRRVERILTGV